MPTLPVLVTLNEVPKDPTFREEEEVTELALTNPTTISGVPVNPLAVVAIPTTSPVKFPIIPPENVETPLEFTFPVTLPVIDPINPPVAVIIPETLMFEGSLLLLMTGR